MSFFNNVEKVAYKKETQDPVILLEYIKFSDEKAQEKYLLFKFKNVLTQQLKEMRVLVNLYDENHYLIGTTVFEHKNFVAKGLEEFVPTAKLLVHYNTKYIEVSVVKAVFDTLVWEENELRPLERVTFESDVFQERKTVKTSYRPKEDIVIPKGARKTKYKDVTKSNKVLFPKLLAGLLLLVLIGITVYGVYNVTQGSATLSDSNFKYEIVSKTEVAITEYEGNKKTVTIPEKYKSYNVTTINADAFKNSNVETVTFDNGSIVIKKNAFNNCKNLIEVNDDNGVVKKVYSGAFNNCTKLLLVKLPNAVILDDAFVNCNFISELSIKEVDSGVLMDTGAPRTLSKLTVANGNLDSIFFTGYNMIKELHLTGEASVPKNALTNLRSLSILWVYKDAVVVPAALNTKSIELHLHEQNQYSQYDYYNVNANLYIILFK